VISIKAGSAQASAAPDKTLRMASVANDEQAACNIRKTPHKIMLAPKYLPSGYFCMRKFVGKAHARNPK